MTNSQILPQSTFRLRWTIVIDSVWYTTFPQFPGTYCQYHANTLMFIPLMTLQASGHVYFSKGKSDYFFFCLLLQFASEFSNTLAGVFQLFSSRREADCMFSLQTTVRWKGVKTNSGPETTWESWSASSRFAIDTRECSLIQRFSKWGSLKHSQGVHNWKKLLQWWKLQLIVIKAVIIKFLDLLVGFTGHLNGCGNDLFLIWGVSRMFILLNFFDS